MLFYFHGDTGGGYNILYDYWIQRNIADEWKLILVALDAPYRADQQQSTCWWTPAKHDRAKYVRSFEDKLLAAFDIRRDRIYLAGSSGGAYWSNAFEFYTDWSRTYNHILLSGGDVPRVNSDTDYNLDDVDEDDDATLGPKEIPATSLRETYYYYAVGTGDWATKDVRRAVKYYRKCKFHNVYATYPTTANDKHAGLDKFTWLLAGIQYIEAAKLRATHSE